MPLNQLSNGHGRSLSQDHEQRAMRERFGVLELRPEESVGITLSRPAVSFLGPSAGGPVRAIAARPILRAQLNQNIPSIVQGFLAICNRWRLPDADKSLILNEANQELCELIFQGRVRLTNGDMSDRMGYLVWISTQLGTLFRNDQRAELRWLNTIRPELNAQSPLGMMLTGKMQNLLNVVALVREDCGMS